VEIRRQGQQHYYLQRTPLEQASYSFVNGAVAGMISAACTTPFDVIKTRQQTFAMQQAASTTTTTLAAVAACHHNGASVYEAAAPVVTTNTITRPKAYQQPTWSYLRHIAQNEGVSALWKGNQTRMLKVAPSCAIMISSYEFGKRMLE
jgi:solute carrier family 25 protein 39/40